MGLTEFKIKLVHRVPDQLKFGVLYVCFDCNVVVHLCPCGCGEKVVLPIAPSCWSVQYDGESISLNPSIGNFQYPCKSHYWIRNNKVVWAGREELESENPIKGSRSVWYRVLKWIKKHTKTK